MISFLPATVALLLGLPAPLQDIPTYTCDTVRGDPGVSVLFGNCHASPGAVTNGPFAGEAIGVAVQVPLKIKCVSGGTAALPDEVTLQDCVQIG
ncbi:hypothetical protein SAMN05444920_10180 [Nonomuraea solani]|uniref:Uncharacterized protein n=1 Tax=Nonomuraea solani TaxID=1144553 RepID=A0A1H5T0P7_9ACTN|nr:hypothetical protein [Nonomuraea solani]SEF56403.1 hypothetical protein SAMN05444920_10180 [Nonomuraea solani]